MPFFFDYNVIMALINEYESSGNILFKKRSYIPLILYILSTLVIYLDENEFAEQSNLIFSIICLLISLFGLFIRIITIGYAQKGTSGRNVHGQKAEALNTKGIYSTVRHPLYLGNFFMWLGIVVYVANLWLIIAVILLFWVYYERIMFAEERYLMTKFGDKYIDWASGTPAFIPSFKSYVSNDMKFNFRDVVRREYHGLTALGVSFAYINFIKNYFERSVFEIEPFWSYFLIISIIAFLILRFIKKKTKVFEI
jgi:protein-S-isoprenylcysteine O-methyltransferase Ste14